MPDPNYDDVIAAALSKRPPLMKIVRGAEKLKGVQPDLLEHWNNLQGEFSKAGLSPAIKSGFRTAEQQNSLHRRGYPTKGNDGYLNISPHQEGRALDVSFAGPQKERGRQIISDYAKRSGLHVPGDEPWHIALPKPQQADNYDDVVKAALPQSPQVKQSDSYDDVVSAALSKPVKQQRVNRDPFANVKAGVGASEGLTRREVPSINRILTEATQDASGPRTFEEDRALRRVRAQRDQQSRDEVRRRVQSRPGDTSAEYKNFLLMNRATDSDQMKEAFLDLQVKQQIAGSGGDAATAIAREDAETARKQRVAKMGVGERLSQVPKSVIGGFAGGVGSSLKGIAALNKMMDRPLGGYGEKETTDLPAYRLGEYITEFARDNPLFKSDPDLEQELMVGKAPSTIGQVAQFMLGGWASKSPKLAVAVLGSSMTAGDAYDEVRARGGSDDEAVNAGLLAGGLLGPTELIGMRGAMKALKGTAKEATWKAALKKAYVEGRRDLVENAGQEMGQELGQGFITKTPRTGAQIAEAGALGAIGGTATAPLTAIRNAPTGAANARQTEIQRQGVQTEQPDYSLVLNPQKFQHLQFGEVEVLADQSGARSGRLKVAEVADPSKQHYVRKADMQGRGNSQMIPVKTPAEETRLAETAIPPPVTPEVVRPQTTSTPLAPQVIRAYRGGSTPLESLDVSKSKVGTKGRGIYLALEKAGAVEYAGLKPGRTVQEADVSLAKPLDMREKSSVEQFAREIFGLSEAEIQQAAKLTAAKGKIDSPEALATHLRNLQRSLEGKPVETQAELLSLNPNLTALAEFKGYDAVIDGTEIVIFDRAKLSSPVAASEGKGTGEGKSEKMPSVPARKVEGWHFTSTPEAAETIKRQGFQPSKSSFQGEYPDPAEGTWIRTAKDRLHLDAPGARERGIQVSADLNPIKFESPQELYGFVDPLVGRELGNVHISEVSRRDPLFKKESRQKVTDELKRRGYNAIEFGEGFKGEAHEPGDFLVLDPKLLKTGKPEITTATKTPKPLTQEDAESAALRSPERSAALQKALKESGYDKITDPRTRQYLMDAAFNASMKGAVPETLPNVPERPETTQSQLETRGFTMIPTGNPRPNIPQGYRAEKTADGVVYYDPKRISRETILKTPTTALLGHVEPKSLKTTEAVVARDAEGTELQASAVSPENVAKQVEVTQANFPEAKVEAGGPEVAQKVLADRLEPSTTSARKSQMAADRAELDLPELPAAERKSWQDTLDKAKEKGTKNASVLADEVLNKPRALNEVETAQLVLRAQEIKNDHARAMKEIGEATNPETIEAKRGEVEALEREFDKLTEATKASGSEKGRALAAQKLTINQDFDLISLVQRAKAAKGRELTSEERTRYEKQAEQITTLEKQLAEANEKAAQAALQKDINRVRHKIQRTETRTTLDTEFADLKAQFAQARAAIKSQSIQPAGFASLDPEGTLTKLIGQMAHNRIRAGTVEAKALVDEVHALLGDLTEGLSKRDIRDAISGYGAEPKGDRRSEQAKQLADVRSELRKLSVQEDIETGKRLPPKDKTRQTVLIKQEAELRRRLEEKDFSKPEERQPPKYTNETFKIQRRINEIKAEFERERYKATRGTWGKIADTAAGIGNVPKTMLSMGDISALLRQGGYGAVTHPILSSKAAMDMLKSFSARGFANVEAEIRNHPKFDEAKRHGVEFTGTDKNDPRLSHKEEGYLGSSVIDTLAKGKGNPLKIVKGIKDVSERTFVSFLDSQRIRLYDLQSNAIQDMKLTPKETRAALTAQAMLINAATGRGNLGKTGNHAAPLLNVAMFSPRLLASRIHLLNKMLNPVAWARQPKGSRSLMMKDNAKFLAFTAVSLGLAKAAGLNVNFDPDDAEFLKIKVGDTRYDQLTGLQQPMRFMLRMAQAVKGGETYAGDSKSKLIMDFARTKAAPMAGYAWDYAEGQNRLSGKKFEAGKDLARNLVPLPMQEFNEAIKNDGALRGIIEAFPSLLGVGVQTYKSGEKPSTHAEKLARRFVRNKLPSTARDEEQIDLDRAKADLRVKSRRGEDVTEELNKLGASITSRQTKAILDARNKTRLQEDTNRLGAKDAIIVWSVMTPGQREETRSLLEHKATLIDNLPESEQLEVRRRYAEAGIEAKSKKPISNPFTRGFNNQFRNEFRASP